MITGTKRSRQEIEGERKLLLERKEKIEDIELMQLLTPRLRNRIEIFKKFFEQREVQLGAQEEFEVFDLDAILEKTDEEGKPLFCFIPLRPVQTLFHWDPWDMLPSHIHHYSNGRTAISYAPPIPKQVFLEAVQTLKRFGIGNLYLLWEPEWDTGDSLGDSSKGVILFRLVNEWYILSKWDSSDIVALLPKEEEKVKWYGRDRV